MGSLVIRKFENPNYDSARLTNIALDKCSSLYPYKDSKLWYVYDNT